MNPCTWIFLVGSEGYIDVDDSCLDDNEDDSDDASPLFEVFERVINSMSILFVEVTTSVKIVSPKLMASKSEVLVSPFLIFSH